MSTLAAAWPALTGPRVEDFWVEVLGVIQGTGRRPNLITGDSADFEGGTTGGWMTSWVGQPAGSTVTLTPSSAPDDGSPSMRVTFANSAGGGGTHLPIHDFAYTPGKRYTATVEVYVPTGSPDLTFGDPFGNTATTRSTMKDARERLTITWTAGSTVAYPGLRSRSATTGTEQVWVDKFRLVEGENDANENTSQSVMGRLDGVTGCRVEHNIHSTIRGGMSLSLRDVGQNLDWSRVRFRPWVRVNNLTWPLGVYLPASPSLSHDEHGSAWEVPCLDKMSILDQDVTTATYSLPAGTVVTTAVADLIASTGETSAVTESDLTTRSPMTWEPGTTKLRVINDLLESINFFSIWADRTGMLRAEPSRRPQDRPRAATFAAGETAIHSPQWSREQDIAGVPNRVVLIVEGDGDEPGMTATADNTDPESPYSIPRRDGRVVARTYSNVEAADQATLNDLALRYLAEASTPSATLAVSHATVPLDGNSVVRFADDGVDTLAVVEGWSVDLEPGALMTGTWREVLSS